MHPGRPFYFTLLLQPAMDLDWILGLHFLGSCLDILVHVGGPNALVSGPVSLPMVFMYFLAHLCLFPSMACKMSETPKLVECVSLKSYSLSLVCVLYDSWRYKLCNKDRQQDPPHLVLCSTSNKGMKD